MASDKYPIFSKLTCLAIATVGLLVAETIFLHVKVYQTDSILTEKVNLLERKQGITERKLKELRSGRNVRTKRDMPGLSKLIDQEILNLEALKGRSRRHVESNFDIILRLLKVAHNVGGGYCENVTVVCQKGDRGPKGNAGLPGALGPPGERGEKGRRGKSGAHGIKGDDGQKGEIGPVGVMGPQGPKGDTGLKGDRGLKGGKGLKGEPGLPGRSISKPKIKSEFPKIVHETEGSNLTLFCEAEGNPTPKVLWVFGSKNPESRYSFPVSGALAISNVRESDNGKIKCVAENILGADTAETELSVYTEPKVRLNRRKVIGAAGYSLEVTCSATGNPVPDLTWRKAHGEKRGVAAVAGDEKSIALTFSKLVASDAGYYICEAKNKIGVGSQSTLVEVQERDCSSLKKIGHTKSGIYTVNPDNGNPFSVFCDMENEGGGWTVIQRRTDGSVDFYRNWHDYRTGFGDLENEFWLGNEKIHRLTKRKNMKILFDLEAVDASKAFAEYSTFYIDGKDKQFTLHIGSYSGTAGDSFSGHNGYKFSTKDRDHDTYPDGSCAVVYHGAWWYEKCHASNLNGKYLNGPHKSYADGINWYAFKGHHNSLKRTVMKIKQRN